MSAGLQPGDSAGLRHAFTARELAEYAGLCGQALAATVPEPLIGALFSRLLGMQLPGPGAMYLKQQTEFPAVALPGEMLSATVEVTRVRPDKHLVDLATVCRGEDGRLIASGQALVYVRDQPVLQAAIREKARRAGGEGEQAS